MMPPRGKYIIKPQRQGKRAQTQGVGVLCYIGSGQFWRVQILNFNIYGGFRKKNIFWRDGRGRCVGWDGGMLKLWIF